MGAPVGRLFTPQFEFEFKRLGKKLVNFVM